jgi:hypothetical protein
MHIGRMTEFSRVAWFSVGMFCLCLPITRAATIFKADTANNLNLAASWSNNVAPGASDVATWNHLVVNNTNSALGANLNWSGVKILDPAGPVTLAAGNTLTLGASGVDLSLAANSLTFSNNLALGANQTWSVTNGQALTVAGVVSGAHVLTITNSGTVILGGTNTYSAGTVISNAVVQSKTVFSFGSGTVTNNGGTLLLRGFPAAGIMTNAFYVTGTSFLDMAGGTAAYNLNGAWSGNGTILITNDTSSGSTLTLAEPPAATWQISPARLPSSAPMFREQAAPAICGLTTPRPKTTSAAPVLVSTLETARLICRTAIPGPSALGN